MMITIAPFLANLNSNNQESPFRKQKKEDIPPVVYWGVYLNNRQISYTSSKDLAEKTKLWIERWLQDKV